MPTLEQLKLNNVLPSDILLGHRWARKEKQVHKAWTQYISNPVRNSGKTKMAILFTNSCQPQQ